MTRNKKIRLILLLFFIILTILRECGLLSLSFYNSHVTSGQAHSFNDFTNEAPGSLRDVPLIVKCKGYEYGQSGTPDHPAVIINVYDISHGPLWIPLYKHVNYTGGLMISIQRNGHDITGTISLNGTLAINGICSRRDANRILITHVMQEVYNIVRAQMDSDPHFQKSS